jgi:chromosome segregation ATPase
MEELEYMLKSIAGCQTDLRQVILTADQFSMMHRMIGSVFDILREKNEEIADLTSRLKKKTQEADDMREDHEMLSETMQEWGSKVERHIESVRQENRHHAEMNNRWVQEVKIEQRKNEFLEATVNDYSSKVAALRAEVSILTRQTEKLKNEKEILQENFKRQENSLQAQIERCRSFRDKYEREVEDRKKDNISWELRFVNENRHLSQEVSRLQLEITDLVESLKTAKETMNLMELKDTKRRQGETVIEDALKDRDKETKKLEGDLQKAKKELEKCKGELASAKKTMKEQERLLAANQVTITKLEADLENHIQELEAAKEQLENQEKAKTNSENEMKKTKGKKDADLKALTDSLEESSKSLRVANEVLTKGTFANFKQKSEYLAKLFNIEKTKVPKTKNTYLQLIEIGLEKKVDHQVGPRTSRGSSKSHHHMDEEKPVTKDRRNSKKTDRTEMSPEQPQKKLRADNADPVEEDTALKKAMCNHSKIQPGCPGCDLDDLNSKRPAIANTRKLR